MLRLNRQPAVPVVRQAVRVLVAIGASELLAHLMHLEDAAWALITSAVVTQTTIGETVSSGRTQLLGALIGGAVSLCAIALRQAGVPEEIALWAALIPLALLAAWRPATRLGLVTVLIALLFPSEGAPFLIPIERVICVLTGVVVSMVVSFAVLHGKTRRDAFHTAAAMIRRIGDTLSAAAQHSIRWQDIAALDTICADSLRQISGYVAEARRERWTSLEKRDPLLAGLPPMLHQLQTDAMVFARTALASPVHDTPAAQAIVQKLVSSLEQIADACDKEADGTHAPGETARKAIDVLPDDGATDVPEWRFICRILRADITGFFDFLTPDQNNSQTSNKKIHTSD